MITEQKAAEIARTYVECMSKASGLPLLIQMDKTHAFPGGWLFNYGVDTEKDPSTACSFLAGNAPIIVASFDGAVHVTGTAESEEYYIANFLKYGTPYPRE